MPIINKESHKFSFSSKIIYTILTFSLILILLIISVSSILINFSTPYFVMEYYSLLYDASVNEQTNQALIESIDENNGIYNQTYDYQAISVNQDESELESSFNNFLGNETQAVFASGYLFENAIQEREANQDEGFIIYVDDATEAFVNSPNTYISSITIAEITSGFEAGFLSSIYVTTIYDDPSEWTLGMWGGFPFPSIVSFMTGFQIGIMYFQYLFQDSINGVDQIELIAPFEGNNPEQRWYTNSFELDDSGTTATANLTKEDNDAKVIYPIAGIQTKEALDYVYRYNLETKVIGVDNDASEIYPGYEDEILFSTIKDFETPIKEDVGCFYSFESDSEISSCLKQNEVYASSLVFNHDDPSNFDKIISSFIDKYNLSEKYGEPTSMEVIQLLESSQIYKILLENATDIYSCTFTSEDYCIELS